MVCYDVENYIAMTYRVNLHKILMLVMDIRASECFCTVVLWRSIIRSSYVEALKQTVTNTIVPSSDRNIVVLYCSLNDLEYILASQWKA